MAFLPKGTQRPTTGDSSYFKLKQSRNKIRIITSAVVGYETWDNKQPTRTKTSNPEAIEEKMFWSCGVIDRVDGKLKIWTFTQKSIMNALMDIIEDEDFGDPKNYDLTIIREGESLETRYTVLPLAPKKLTESEQALVGMTNINLEVLFDGGNPLE